MKIKSVEKIPRNDETIYNLEIEDNHNYYANNILVSNCHQLSKGNNVAKFVSSQESNIRFGFTATLPEFEIDKWNIIGLCGKILSSKFAYELQEMGYICDVKLYSLILDHKIYQPTPEDKSLSPLEKAKRMYPLEVDVIESSDWANSFICKLALKFKDKNGLILIDHIDHGNKIFNLLKKLNKSKKLFYIDGGVDLDVRENCRKYTEKNNDSLIVAQRKTFGTGINIKNLDYLIFASPVGKSSRSVIQNIGRALRIKDGKKFATIFDVHHSFRYSRKHFNERKELYYEHYKVLDIKTKKVDKN